MINHSKKNKNIGNRLRKRYIFAFSIIASLVILSQLIIQFVISGQESDSRVINIAGRQRMLSQRINKAVFGLYLAEDEKSKNAYFNELTFSVDLWKKSHIGLQNGDSQLGLPDENSKVVRQLFASIEHSHQTILKASYDIISIVEKGNYTKQDLYPKIQQIKENEAVFLKGMDTIVFQYDYESKGKINFIKHMELALLFITLFVLLMELIFIFRPAKNEINKAFAEIQGSYENLLNLFETSPAPMFLIDEESLNIMQLNNLAEEILWVKSDNPINLRLDSILKNSPGNKSNIIEKIKNNRKTSNEEALLRTYGKKNIVILISSSKINFYGKAAILLCLSDITKLKKAEKILKRYATVDEMTGFLNKRSGMLLLENAFEKAKGDISDLSLCFIDIDGLKTVNDTYGHDEGDWYIKAISKTILENMRPEDCVFRYGGDEIVLVLIDCDTLKAQSILKIIKKSLSIIKKEHNKPYKISISYGIVNNNSANTNNIYEFIKLADQVMYENKKRKKSSGK